MFRSREQMLDLADYVEELMLRGYTTASQISKNTKQFQLTRHEAQQYIDHVYRRWARGTGKQDRDSRRAESVQMHLHALREAYDVMREAKQSVNGLKDRNTAIANVIRILGQLADLEGLRERTVRVGGDRDNIPVQIQTQSTHAVVLENMMQQGYIDATTYAAIESAILSDGSGRAELDGTAVAESLRQADPRP